ncbi:MAG TPA: 5-(carboxyamino)imidazole ribonucleotide synthase [Gaiellaceae bacterium]|nr:5-(carboxyamino)imidazole ribonucleotide synthase [Gaiellaceae bacterium]
MTRLVGCIGGGQLGRMLALAGAPLGVRMRFLDPAPDACAGDVGELVVGAYDDPAALDRLAEGADAVTYEFENVPVEAARRVRAIPDARALELGQDRLVEKELFRRVGIETAPFGSLADTGLPALVKSRRLGYDGKGQRVVALDEPLAPDELAEGIVAFDRELSVVAVRGRDGETRFYPLAENKHRGGILAVSRAPAADAPQREAEEIATRLLDELGYVGVLAVELFDVGGRLLANEFAPRVHNTGHWTIDGAETSQFESHVRAVLGLPLGSTAGRGPSVMVNLVGGAPPLDRLLAVPGARVHLYGKEPRPGRKVGHVTLVDAPEGAVDHVLELADAAWA